MSTFSDYENLKCFRFSGCCNISFLLLFQVLISRLFAKDIDPAHMKKLKECWNRFDENNDGQLTLDQFKSVMTHYEHGYLEYQVEAMFESLDWDGTQTISFNKLLTAFSYQRLVAVDERLWDAFSTLDIDGDRRITKREIHTVFKLVDPDRKLGLFEDEFVEKVQIHIRNAVTYADGDGDGKIDYEEFLLALHPQCNEAPVTPRYSKFNEAQQMETIVETIQSDQEIKSVCV